MMAQVVFSFSL